MFIVLPSLLNDSTNKATRNVIHPHRTASVSVDDAKEEGTKTDDCLITATNDSSETVRGFRVITLHYGQPTKEGEPAEGSHPKVPAISLPNQSFDIKPGDKVS